MVLIVVAICTALAALKIFADDRQRTVFPRKPQRNGFCGLLPQTFPR